jgi:hypothetical protein
MLYSLFWLKYSEIEPKMDDKIPVEELSSEQCAHKYVPRGRAFPTF